MKKTILFAVSFLVGAIAVYAQQAETQAVNAENVPIEEYVPKVIIEGKWGTGPGEFGVAWTYASDTESPMSPSGSKSMPIYPSSLAVDGKGNIYVLDAINNRIQKFDAEGKFLKAMAVDAYMGEEQPIWYGKVKAEDGREILDRVDSKGKSGKTVGVDAWFPYYWPITIEGINIVIDSKDTLYYYLKRTKDGKETGEAWEFRKDKLVRKIPGDSHVSSTDMPRKHVNVRARNEREIDLTFAGGKRLKLIAGKGGKFFDDGQARKRRISNKVWLGKDGLLGVVSEHDGQLWTNYYNEDGVLVKKFRWSSKPSITGYFDKNRNIYLPEITRTGLRIVKYELREVK
jgi:hypothetical protein